MTPGEELPLQVVRVTRPDLVGCTLIGPDGEPAPVHSEVVRTPTGGWGSTRCTAGGGPKRTTAHLLWPPGGGPITVRLSGPAGEGRLTLRGPQERCEMAARPPVDDEP